MKQMTMIENWIGADIDLSKIEKHPSLYAGKMIAYQPVLSYFPPHNIAWYHCIHKDNVKSRYPYHIGTFEKDLSKASYDCMGREYQLSNEGFWFQRKPPEGSPRYVQWADWIWKNEGEKQLFHKWLRRHFGSDDEQPPENNKPTENKEVPEQLSLF